MANHRPIDRTLDRLKTLHPKAIDLTLGRIEFLLERLGAPHRTVPPAVHVAGTNGKGSSIAFLRSCLEAAGYRVHVYTSPHLVRFAERIRLAGEIIDDDRLESLLDECERANQGGPITFFEITTAAAFLAFARVPADILLLETGLGGRLDATNVIDRPLLTAITPVSLDHVQYLGTTLAGIAVEKAGILKPSVVAVVGRQGDEALAPIRVQAERVGASLALIGRDWDVGERDGRLVLRDGESQSVYPAPGLAGPHQFDNAGLAIVCANRLDGFALDADAIAAGLAAADWPGRLQKLKSGRLFNILPMKWELWLDGGHNAAAGAALAAAVRPWSNRPLHLVIGMLDSKQPEEFAAPLAAHADSITCVPVAGEPASLLADELAHRLGALDTTVQCAGSVGEALDSLANGVSGAPPSRVLVCGSLYLLGTVLAENEDSVSRP